MSKNTSKFVGNFHIPGTDKHPSKSLGNQQIWESGKQIGSIEYLPNSETQNLDLNVFNHKGSKISNL